MNLNNSGDVVVFDPKSQEAIDMAKNRIDELNNDIARLQKAKQVEQADVKEAQDEKVYLEGQLELLRPEVDILNTLLTQGKKEKTQLEESIKAQQEALDEDKANLAVKEEEFASKQDLFNEERANFDAQKLQFIEESIKQQAERDNLTQIKSELEQILTKI